MHIYDEFYGSKGELLPEREYFIGSIMVCRNAQGAFDLIDGQQRTTTIFLLRCSSAGICSANGTGGSSGTF